MTNPISKRVQKRPDNCQTDKCDQATENSEQKSPEEDPAVDRGERIATGKAIARGGKSSGYVHGAQPNSDS